MSDDEVMTVSTTPDQFEQDYAERSGQTVAEIREHSKVVPCDCDLEECEGWGMVSLDSDTCGECGHYNFRHNKDGSCSCGCREFTTERRWPRDARPTDGTSGA